MYLHHYDDSPDAPLYQVHGENVMRGWSSRIRECNGFAYSWKGRDFVSSRNVRTSVPRSSMCACVRFKSAAGLV